MLSICLLKNWLEVTQKILLEYWISCNHNVRMILDGYKLANVQRDIMNNKRLTDFELTEIKEKATTYAKDIDSGNAGISYGDVDDRDEVTGSVSCTDAGVRKARTKNIAQKEYVNHMRALDHITIDSHIFQLSRYERETPDFRARLPPSRQF